MKVEYNKFTIQSVGDKFIPFGDRAGAFIVFWVVSNDEKIRSRFILAQSLFDALGEGKISNKKSLLKDELVKIIKGYIDKDEIKDLDEYTFEYENNNIQYEPDPEWWRKNLKKYLPPTSK